MTQGKRGTPDVYEGWTPREVAQWEVARLMGESGSLERLQFLREYRAALAEVEQADVDLLRENGVPWTRIGAALGVTGQAVSMRYGAKR